MRELLRLVPGGFTKKRHDLILYLSPSVSRLLAVGEQALICEAAGTGGPPGADQVSAALARALAGEPLSHLAVVIGPEDCPVAWQPVQRPSAKNARAMLVAGMESSLPGLALRSADLFWADGQGHLNARFVGAGSWPELDAWLAWLAGLPCELDGPWLLPSLLVDATWSPGAAGQKGLPAGVLLLLVRDSDDATWMFGLLDGRLQMVRHLDAASSGHAISASRVDALALEVRRSVDSFSDSLGVISPLAGVEILDVPEVCAGLVAALGLPPRDCRGPVILRQVIRHAGATANLLDAFIAASLMTPVRPSPAEPAQWRERRVVRARGRLAGAAVPAAAMGCEVTFL